MTASIAITESLRYAASGLAQACERADRDALLAAAEILAHVPRVITCASGSSGFVAAKLAHSLCCVDRPAKFMPPSEAIHGGLGAVQPGDAVVMISRGGATVELLPIIDVVGARGAKLIGVTENLESRLAAASDVVIPLVIQRESDPLNVMATTSNLVAQALLDAVLAAVMDLTGYRLEQFAQIHPGGAVGARLNLSPSPQSAGSSPCRDGDHPDPKPRG